MFLDDIKDQVIGIDEVGRGAFSGPVVSCSVLLSEEIIKSDLVFEINDSKKFQKKKELRAEFIKKIQFILLEFLQIKKSMKLIFLKQQIYL